MRFWTLKDRTGAVVPNTYLMSIDYNGINYDYNDNVYLISNIRPQPDGTTQFRLDVGGASSFTDSLGRTWTPDNSTQFTPSSAIAEPGSLPDDVLNTTDDVIYRTYRGNVGSLTPRTLSYALPVPNGKYNVRLHFAERCTCDTTVGSRVFNVQIEGAAVSSNFDIVKAAGAANTALVVPYYHVNVADGVLNISFTAVVDYASIAGIEVVADP
jgi:malectin (di-glucose binding ER protein)